MCGLTGIFDPLHTMAADALRATVERMAAALHHRGPDDGGQWTDPAAGLALGFRRLAIVDLSPLGHQPMECDRGRFVLAFNGEIYNFEELRADLLSSGPDRRPFRGRSDTEVMLRAFETWGVQEALKRFVGMFAFALWDRAERTLWLARDRFGEKPLYYGWQGGLFLFGSELKSLRACPKFDAAIDRSALASFLRYGYVPAPDSIYTGIRKLPPGTLLRLTTDASPDSTLTPTSYWDARDAAQAAMADPFAGSDVDAIDHLDGLLRKVITNQMIADVPLGAFLSGGTDSSTVVAIMQAISARPVKTFTIGFQEDQYNEAEHAKRVARHLGTQHTELYVTPAEAMQVIPSLPALYDEPFADSSQIPTYLVSKLARQHVTVSLSGDGGDEFFAGYGWYATAHRLWRKIGWAPRPLRAAVAGAMAALPVGAWDAVLGAVKFAVPRPSRRDATGDKVHKFAHVLASGTSPEHTHRILVSRWNGDSRIVLGNHRCPPTLDQVHGGLDVQAHPILRLMYADTMTYLPDNILAKVDRASMGVSLESRAPLLDHRVYEFAWRLPMHMKVRDGRGKWLLRQVLHRYVPPEIVDRPKMGFCVPIDFWLRGALRDWADGLLAERRLRQDGYLDPAPIREKFDQHVSGARNWQHHLWNVLMFQSWLASN
jgi:asparagine synthase (glutamine-hydrolysing)